MYVYHRRVQGLGLALVKKLLSKGYRVAATSRNIEELQEAVGADGDAFLPLAVNLTMNAAYKRALATLLIILAPSTSWSTMQAMAWRCAGRIDR